MPNEGHNCILFDFDSIVDLHISIIKWMAAEYREYQLPMFDKFRIMNTPIDELKFERLYSAEGLFKSLIKDPDMKPRFREIAQGFLNEYEEEIVGKYAEFTIMPTLISAYKKAGNGIIKCSVRCDNEFQKKFVEDNVKGDPTVFISTREDTDTSKYGRIISGDAFNIMKYKFYDPKSVVVLNYRENFSPKDITLLTPELLINLGEIHTVEAISAYREDGMGEISG